MNKSIFLIISSIIILFSSCKTESMNCGLDCGVQSEELIFQTGFTNTVLTDQPYSKVSLSGTDPGLAYPNSWDDFLLHPNMDEIQISYEDGDNSQRLASIVDDPDSIGNKVMKFQIMEPHIKEGTKKKSRVQLNIGKANCLKEIYQTVRLKIHPDMAHLMNWNEKVHWLSFFEFWNNADWSKEKYPFRVTVNFIKDYEGPVTSMHFAAKGDYKNNCKLCKWHDDWVEKNESFSVPFGQWMEIEIYIKEGDASNGRFYMAVTPEGGAKVVVFDIYNNTQHDKETCPDGFSHLQPMKLYTSGEITNYMKDAGKELAIYWDDWKFYKNKQP